MDEGQPPDPALHHYALGPVGQGECTPQETQVRVSCLETDFVQVRRGLLPPASQRLQTLPRFLFASRGIQALGTSPQANLSATAEVCMLP